MRFYLDADLSYQVAEIARAQGLDVVSAQEQGRAGLKDDELLRLVAQEGRCLVTRNRNDFIKLTVTFFGSEWPHAGVLIVPRSLPNDDFAGIARALAAYAEAHEGDMQSYIIDYLAAQRPSG